jgi:hypothetical protein
MLFLFSKKFSENSEYIDRIHEVELDKTQPYIDTTRVILFKKFQRSINAVQMISEYYEFYSKELRGSINETFIKKFTYNVLYVGDNKQIVIDFISRGDNSSYLGIDILM